MAAGNHYQDRFLSPDRMQWQSQNQTGKDSRHGKILSGSLPDWRVHLFVRSEKMRGSKAAPFIYLGRPTFMDWEGEKPITVFWKLPRAVPEHLHEMFGITLSDP